MNDRGFLKAGGHRLEYQWHGPPPSGTPSLVFLHEGLGSLSLWRDIPEAMAADCHHGALVYSRAGYGRSDPWRGRRAVDFMHREASQVLPEVLDAARIESAILVGHSDGASIALLFAARYPARTRALVLEAPHVLVEDLCTTSISELRRSYRTGELRQRLTRHHQHVDRTFHGWADIWLEPSFAEWNIEAELREIRSPALLIQGLDDQYGTLAQIRAISSQLSGQVTSLLLSDCGHAPHRDRRSAVLNRCGAWIRSLPP